MAPRILIHWWYLASLSWLQLVMLSTQLARHFGGFIDDKLLYYACRFLLGLAWLCWLQVMLCACQFWFILGNNAGFWVWLTRCRGQEGDFKWNIKKNQLNCGSSSTSTSPLMNLAIVVALSVAIVESPRWRSLAVGSWKECLFLLQQIDR